MLRKCLLAGMSLALVASPVLSTAAQADHRDRDNDNGNKERYYIVRAADGSCRVRMSQRFEVLGQYRSWAGANRALAVKKTIGEC